MSDKDEYIRIGVTVDEASFAKLDQKNAASQTKLNDLAKATDQATASANKLASSVGKIGEVLDEGARMEADFVDFQQKLDTQTQSTDVHIKQLTKDTGDLVVVQKQAKDMLSNGSDYLGYGAEGGLIGPAEAPSEGSSGGGSGSLRMAGRALNQLGVPGGQQLQQIGDIALVGKEVGVLTEAVGGLGVAIPVVGVAVAAVAGGFYLLNQALEGSRKDAEDAITYTKAYYEAISKGTTETLQVQIKSLEVQKQINEAKLRDLEGRSLAKSIEDLNSTFGVATLAVDEASGGLKKYADEINPLKDENESLTIKLQALHAALGDTNVATNDAAAAEQKLADVRKQMSTEFLSSLDKQAQNQIELAQLQKDGSAKQIQSVIDSNQIRIDALEDESGAILRSSDKSDEAIKKAGELIAETNRLKEVDQYLIDTLLPARKAQEAYAESVKDATKDLLDFAKASEKVKANLSELKTKYDEQSDQITASRKLASERDESDYQRKRQNALIDNSKKLAAEDVDYYSARSKKIRDFTLSQKATEDKANTERIKDIRDYGESQRQTALDYAAQVADIESKSKNSRIDAAAHLDARALDQELRNRNQQLSSATDKYNAEQQKKKEALDRQLADLAANTQEEERQRAEAFRLQLADDQDQHDVKRSREIAAFNDQLARQDDERKVAIQRQLENFKLEDAARKASYDKQVAALTASLSKMEAIQQKSWDKIATGVSNVLNKIDAGLNQLAAKATSTMSSIKVIQDASNGGRVHGHFADGGYPQLNVPVRVGERGPETAIFTQPTRIYPNGASPAGGGHTINFNAPLYLGGDLASPQAYAQVRGLMQRALEEIG